MKNVVKAFALAGILAISAAAANAAPTVSIVGIDTTTQGSWRTTDVVKPYTVNGNSYYGVDGYQVYGVNPPPGGATITEDPTTSATHTLTSLPSWLTVTSFDPVPTNYGGANASSCWGSSGFDNPQLTPSTSVADISLGEAANNGGGWGMDKLVRLTFGAGTPAAFRLGVIDGVYRKANAPVTVGEFDVNLWNFVNGQTQNFTTAGANQNYAFYDVTGAQSGDSIVVGMDISVSHNGGNPGISGLMVDVVPEPTSLSLLGLGAAAMLGRRRVR